MALRKCPDCGGPVSDLANTCPKCGRPANTITSENVDASEKHEQKPVGGGCVIAGVLLAIVALVALLGLVRNEPGNDAPNRYKIKTPQGKAESERCLRLATDHVEIGDDSKVFVPQRAITVLRKCMGERGFTKEETQIMVDAMTGQ